MDCFLAADYMMRLKSLCFLVSRTDLLKSSLHCIRECLTNEKFLIIAVLFLSSNFLNGQGTVYGDLFDSDLAQS